MGNPTGGYQTIAPILGSQQQQQYLQTIASQAFNTGPNGQGPNTIQGITPYGGQLTPDLSQMMLSGVDTAWSPNSPGQAQMAQQYGNILGQQNQVNAANPLAALQKYAGGAGSGSTMQTPSNPYSALMTPPANGGGSYTYQTPTSAPQSSSNGSPTGLQQSSVPVQFNNAPVTPPAAQPAPVTPNVPYQAIADPYLLPGQLGGVGGGSMTTSAWQQMMNGGQPATSLSSRSSSNIFAPRTPQLGMPQSPYVNYNPAFSAAAWSPSFT